MRVKLFSSALLLSAIIPLSIGLSSCSNEKGVVNTKNEEGVVNTMGNALGGGSEVIGKFNCNTGEAKSTKDYMALAQPLEKNKWYSKEDFISTIYAEFETLFQDESERLRRSKLVYNRWVKQSKCDK